LSTRHPRRRGYRQFCGAARALDIVGERWTLLIVRNLLLGPRRFSELRAELPGITTNLLAKRLKEMIGEDLVRRVALAPPLRTEAYALTERGLALEPALLALARWGGATMSRRQRGEVVNPAWALLTLKNLYRGGLDLELELRIDGRVFELLYSSSYLRIQERAATRPVAVVSGALEAFGRLFYGGVAPERLQKEGAIEIAGDAAAFEAAVAACRPTQPAGV
jgi:DNA-binding HxlR family transcriptional regulator